MNLHCDIHEIRVIDGRFEKKTTRRESEISRLVNTNLRIETARFDSKYIQFSGE